MSDSSPRLVMPEDEYAIVTRAWRQWLDSPLKAALEQAIADAVAAERERAERAEAKLAAITAHCRKHALHAQLHCPDLGRPAEALVKADAILAIIDGTGEEAAP